MRKLIKAIARRFGREEGAATVEFVLFFPMFMYLGLSSFEVSFYMLRTALLDHSVDKNVRLLRLGSFEPMTQDALQDAICRDAMLLRDCPTSVRVELVEVSTSAWNLPNPQITCVDRDANIQPAVTFSPGVTNELMIVRVCAMVKPFFAPTRWVMALPIDAHGEVAITSVSTFLNES
ncbi:MAG: pilus assembly protein TadE [Rhodobacterales bacterium]|nr:MAG: pilus assembly protein TadE [Rhodobacterales bacterium]